jgi:hypothetical protein
MSPVRQGIGKNELSFRLTLADSVSLKTRSVQVLRVPNDLVEWDFRRMKHEKKTPRTQASENSIGPQL